MDLRQLTIYMGCSVWFTHMKTTVNLNDELLRRAKRHAAKHGRTLTSVLEEALRELLARGGARKPFSLDLPTVKGDRPPRVDPADRSALYDAMDADAS